MMEALQTSVLLFLSEQGPQWASPVLKLYKSKNRHVLCYYYTPGASSIDLKWVLTRTDESGKYTHVFEDVNMVHSLVLGADVVKDNVGVLQPKLRAPVSVDAPMRLVQDEDGVPMILSEIHDKAAILDSIYVNLDTPSQVEVFAHGIDAESGAKVRAARMVDLSGLPLE